jgi:uncharacterized protein
MKMLKLIKMKTNDFLNKDERKRFELKVEDKIAFIEYILNNENILFLTHTEVPTVLEGKGIGSKIVEKTLNYAKEGGFKIAPLCPNILNGKRF